MYAAVLHAPFDLRLEEVAAPVPAQGQVVIAVKTVGICGGDVHFFTGHHPYGNYPRIHGHEVCGVIDRIGPGVAGFRPGERVVLEPLLPCGDCYPCSIGRYNCCDNLRVVGAHVDGAFAQYLPARAEFVHKIPDSVSDLHGAVVEPYTIAAHCITRTGVQLGDMVLVLGCGAIGLCLVDLLANLGAEVVAADLSPFRLDLAGKMGAGRTLPAGTDLAAAIDALTGGRGMPIVMEATGSSKMMELTERLVAGAGKIMIVGLTNDKVCFTGINITKREMTVLGSRNSAGEFPRVIETMAAGGLHPEVLITHRRPFAQITAVFRQLAENNSRMGKVVLEL